MITTIQLEKETKEKIATFGEKGESYDEIIKKLYSIAVKVQLKEFLMSKEGFVPVEDALKEAKKRWPE